jgi:hypothetical protein
MKRIAIIAMGTLALAAGAFAGATSARADEEAGFGRSVHREARVVRRHAAHRPRRIVREVVFDPYDVGPPPFAYGPPPRFAYGPRFFRPPLRPVGYGPGFGFGYGPYF